MDEQKKKLIFDVECITCKHFFGCKHGKETFGRPCISFEERGDSKWQNAECSLKQ